jgi:cell division transport system permease protein
VRENITFKVYTKSSLSETQLKQVQESLAAKEFVAKDDTPITFVSRDEAAQDLAQLGDYQEVLGDNPYRDMFEVIIDPAYHDSLSLTKIKAELENMNGVYEALYEQDFLHDINKNFTRISLVLIGIDVLLLITVILLINNTMRLALFSQRFLIRSMQLVGARKGFIQRPFLLRAAFYGVLAGLIASGLLYLLTRYAYQRVDMLIQLHNQQHFYILAGSLLGLGAIIAVLSTYWSIRRYLRMSLDELY